MPNGNHLFQNQQMKVLVTPKKYYTWDESTTSWVEVQDGT
jgi:hypothetical protein